MQPIKFDTVSNIKYKFVILCNSVFIQHSININEFKQTPSVNITQQNTAPMFSTLQLAGDSTPKL